MTEAIGSASVRVFYTTAPKAYDYCNQHEQREREAEVFEVTDPYNGRKVTWRKIVVREQGASNKRLDFLAEYQKGRYWSGLHLVEESDPRHNPARSKEARAQA